MADRASVLDPFLDLLQRGVDIAGEGLDKYSSFLEVKNAIKAKKRQNNDMEMQSLPAKAHPSALPTDAGKLFFNALAAGAVIFAGVAAWKWLK